MHRNERENPRRNIVEYDPGAFWKSLQLSDQRRLHDIEDSKKYKTGGKSFPCERDSDERDQLSGDFVDDYELGIFGGGSAGHAGGGGDADQDDESGEGEGNRDLQRRRYAIDGCSPDQDRRGGGPCSWAGMEAADSTEGRDQRGPERGPRAG